jgi:hypothetical protein
VQKQKGLSPGDVTMRGSGAGGNELDAGPIDDNTVVGGRILMPERPPAFGWVGKVRVSDGGREEMTVMAAVPHSTITNRGRLD